MVGHAAVLRSDRRRRQVGLPTPRSYLPRPRTCVWPVAALGVFCFILYTPFGTYQLHALQGLGIPVGASCARRHVLGATWKSPIVLALLAGMLLACIGWPSSASCGSTPTTWCTAMKLCICPAPLLSHGRRTGRINYLRGGLRRVGFSPACTWGRPCLTVGAPGWASPLGPRTSTIA